MENNIRIVTSALNTYRNDILGCDLPIAGQKWDAVTLSFDYLKSAVANRQAAEAELEGHIDTVWGALTDVRNSKIPEDQGRNDAEWDSICDAMDAITDVADKACLMQLAPAM